MKQIMSFDFEKCFVDWIVWCKNMRRTNNELFDTPHNNIKITPLIHIFGDFVVTFKIFSDLYGPVFIS
jgi:hypothetical protein